MAFGNAILLLLLLLHQSWVHAMPAASEDQQPPLSPYKFNERVGQRLIYGDILLSPKQLKMRKLLLPSNRKEDVGKMPIKHIAIKERHNNRWPDNEIPFLFSPKFTERQKQAVREALLLLQANSCFRFVPRNLQRDFLYFDMREGCFSFVGKIGGRQLLSLAAGCLHDYIIWHEVMHALGLEHEHQRPDRDKYIEIQWENVESGKEINFDKIKWADVDLYHTYDYHSLMHYDGTAFGRLNARDRRPMVTMRPLEDGVVLSDNFELTPLDVEKLQILSNCDPSRLKLRPDSGLGPSCSDRSTNCQSLAERGFCAEIRYLRLIRIQCQLTCGFCQNNQIQQQNGPRKGIVQQQNNKGAEDERQPAANGQAQTFEAEEKLDGSSSESEEANNRVDAHYTRWSYPKRRENDVGMGVEKSGWENHGQQAAWDTEDY